MRGPLLDAARQVCHVLIASHDSTHAAFVRACVRAGKPVLCEKPLSPTLDESAAVVSEIGSQAELVSLGFMRRFDPGYVALKAAITGGSIGPPVLLHSTGRGVSGGLGRTNENSVTNSAIHDLDIVPWLLDAPVVEASWHAPRSSAGAAGFQDPQLILLRTADGVLSTVDIFLNARYGYDVRCEVIGESGTASLAEPVTIITTRTCPVAPPTPRTGGPGLPRRTGSSCRRGSTPSAAAVEDRWPPPAMV